MMVIVVKNIYPTLVTIPLAREAMVKSTPSSPFSPSSLDRLASGGPSRSSSGLHRKQNRIITLKFKGCDDFLNTAGAEIFVIS